MSRIRWMELETLCEITKERLHNKADSFVIVTGLPGMGKTTFAVHFAKGVDSAYTMARNLIFDPNLKKILAAVTGLPHYSALVFDEAMRAANKRRFMTLANSWLNELFALCRKEFKLLILCTPTIRQLDSGIVNDRALYWVDVPIRGYAVVIGRPRYSTAKDPFGLSKNVVEEAIRKRFPHVDPIQLTDMQLLEAYASVPNYLCTIKFPPLSEEEEKEYEAAAAEMRKEIKLPQDNISDRAKYYQVVVQKLIAYIYLEDGKSQKEIQDLFQLDHAFVNRALQAEKARPIDQKIKAAGNSAV